MSNFARWEQESRQPLGPLQPDIPTPDPRYRLQETVEVDMASLLGEETEDGQDAQTAPAADAGEPETAAPDAGRLSESTAVYEIAEIQGLLADEADEADEADDDAADDEYGADRGGAARDRLTDARRSLTITGRSIGRWVANLDRRPEFSLQHERDPLAQLSAGPVADDDGDLDESFAPTEQPVAAEEAGGPSRFATAALGYNRQAVDEHVARLEAELAELRADREQEPPAISISEEIERIGEETASILVVAHDKAHETARRAQEQAERRVREADDRAQRITAEAQRRLRGLDEETDAVWRERERLLEDVRVVCTSLNALVDAAAQRFPADPAPMADPDSAEDAASTADPVAAKGH